MNVLEYGTCFKDPVEHFFSRSLGSSLAFFRRITLLRMDVRNDFLQRTYKRTFAVVAGIAMYMDDKISIAADNRAVLTKACVRMHMDPKGVVRACRHRLADDFDVALVGMDVFVKTAVGRLVQSNGGKDEGVDRAEDNYTGERANDLQPETAVPVSGEKVSSFLKRIFSQIVNTPFLKEKVRDDGVIHEVR